MRTGILIVVLGLGLPAAHGEAGKTGADETVVPPASAADTYQLVPQDELVYRIEQDPIKASEPEVVRVTGLNEAWFPVSRGSEIMIPLNVRGKTVNEVKTELKRRLDEKYYRDATISLRLRGQALRPGKAIFFGEVQGEVVLKPGEQLTVSEAILRLRHTEYANLKEVKVNRIDPDTQDPKTIIVNVKEVMEKNKRGKDEVLQDGDRVEVPGKSIRFF